MLTLYPSQEAPNSTESVESSQEIDSPDALDWPEERFPMMRARLGSPLDDDSPDDRDRYGPCKACEYFWWYEDLLLEREGRSRFEAYAEDGDPTPERGPLYYFTGVGDGNAYWCYEPLPKVEVLLAPGGLYCVVASVGYGAVEARFRQVLHYVRRAVQALGNASEWARRRAAAAERYTACMVEALVGARRVPRIHFFHTLGHQDTWYLATRAAFLTTLPTHLPPRWWRFGGRRVRFGTWPASAHREADRLTREYFRVYDPGISGYEDMLAFLFRALHRLGAEPVLKAGPVPDLEAHLPLCSAQQDPALRLMEQLLTEFMLTRHNSILKRVERRRRIAAEMETSRTCARRGACR